jgi:hypothetical protein
MNTQNKHGWFAPWLESVSTNFITGVFILAACWETDLLQLHMDMVSEPGLGVFAQSSSAESDSRIIIDERGNIYLSRVLTIMVGTW